MDEKERRSPVRRTDDPTRVTRRATTESAAASTTLWRMRSSRYDNQASCSVIENGDGGWDVLVVFTKGLGVPERFTDIGAATRHSMEIAGRLTAQGWVDIDLPDG